MENRVVVETPVEGVFTRLGLLFRRFGDIYAPEGDVGFNLEDALQDIRDACDAGSLPDLETDVFDIMVEDMIVHARRQMLRSDYDGRLTECDLVVILLYTCEFPDANSLYAVMNKKLNVPDRNFVKPFVKYIWLLLRALVKCPVSPVRMVYRGIKNADLTSYYPDGHEFEWHQFSSCSCSLAVQKVFTGQVGIRTLFTIELTSSRGRDVCAYSAVQREKEVLLPPNSKFKVTSTFDAGHGLKMIQVVEIPPTDPVVIFEDNFTVSLLSPSLIQFAEVSSSSSPQAAIELTNPFNGPSVTSLQSLATTLISGSLPGCSNATTVFNQPLDGLCSHEDMDNLHLFQNEACAFSSANESADEISVASSMTPVLLGLEGVVTVAPVGVLSAEESGEGGGGAIPPHVDENESLTVMDKSGEETSVRVAVDECTCEELQPSIYTGIVDDDDNFLPLPVSDENNPFVAGSSANGIDNNSNPLIKAAAFPSHNASEAIAADDEAGTPVSTTAQPRRQLCSGWVLVLGAFFLGLAVISRYFKGPTYTENTWGRLLGHSMRESATIDVGLASDLVNIGGAEDTYINIAVGVGRSNGVVSEAVTRSDLFISLVDSGNIGEDGNVHVDIIENVINVGDGALRTSLERDENPCTTSSGQRTISEPFDNDTIQLAVKMWCENVKSAAVAKFGDISTWNTSQVTSMRELFKHRQDFNDPIGNWDVSNVTDMFWMFYGARSFNQSLDSWNVSKVTTMQGMFSFASSFNQPLNSWDVRNVTNMGDMFDYASSFNQPLHSWDVKSVTDMSWMFSHAVSFNQPLDTWNVSSVVYMRWMFYGAAAFNQSLDNWVYNKNVDRGDMLSYTAAINR
jgi:surface protein